MTLLDLRPGRLDLLVRPGNGHTVVVTWPATLDGRTFVATAGENDLPVSTDDAVMTIAVPDEATSDAAAKTWVLTEDGEVLITGHIVRSSAGAPSPTQAATVLLSTGATVDVVAAGAPGADGVGEGGGGVTDHGALTGLADDDHPQYAKKASNLSDLASAAAARTNLGLGTAATQPSGAFDPAGAATTAQAAAIAAAVAADTAKVAKAGDTMTGALALPGDAANALHATPLQQVSALIAAAIVGLIASAPGVLDTLDEIAAALGDDPNFATTVTTLLAAKAALAGATFTGAVAVPDDAYDATAWNGSTNVPTKNAVRDVLVTLATTAAAQAMADAKVEDLLVDGVTTKAPSQNVVSDALALKQALAANLTAFAGLTGAADKGIRFTGAGALAVHDLSAFARTLLDDADQAAMQATLGITSSAPAGVRSIPHTVDPMLQDGAYNICANSVANRATYIRSRGAATISKVGMRVTATGGTISVAICSGTAGRTTPGNRVATSGSVSGPATGYAEVSLGASVAVTENDWFAVSSSGTVQVFTAGSAMTGETASIGLGAGFGYYQDTAHPVPSTPAVTGEIRGAILILVGVT